MLKVVDTLLFVWSICEFLDIKTDEAKSGDFYDNPKAYDVIFTGSSHTVMGVLPMELWDEYQITSYNLGNYGQTLAVDYWVLKDALETCEPQLVVVEVCSTGLDYKYRDTHMPYLHETFDAMKLSGTKINAINDLFEGELYEEFLFPITLYHSRWEFMDDSFFSSVESTYQRGADVNALIGAKSDILTKYIEPVEWLSCDEMNVSDTISKVYLVSAQ